MFATLKDQLNSESSELSIKIDMTASKLTADMGSASTSKDDLKLSAKIASQALFFINVLELCASIEGNEKEHRETNINAENFLANLEASLASVGIEAA